MADFLPIKQFAPDATRSLAKSWITDGAEIWASTSRKIYYSDDSGTSFAEVFSTTDPQSGGISMWTHNGQVYMTVFVETFFIGGVPAHLSFQKWSGIEFTEVFNTISLINDDGIDLTSLNGRTLDLSNKIYLFFDSFNDDELFHTIVLEQTGDAFIVKYDVSDQVRSSPSIVSTEIYFTALENSGGSDTILHKFNGASFSVVGTVSANSITGFGSFDGVAYGVDIDAQRIVTINLATAAPTLYQSFDPLEFIEVDLASVIKLAEFDSVFYLFIEDYFNQNPAQLGLQILNLNTIAGEFEEFQMLALDQIGNIVDNTTELVFGGLENVFYANLANPPLVIVATVVENNIFIEVTGGSPGYIYQWDDGPQTQNRLDVDPGEYTVTVTDSVGTEVEATVTVGEFRFFFSKNPIELPLVAELPQTKPNLSFVAEVWIEKIYLSDNFEKVISVEQPAKIDGSTVFDFQEAVNAFLNSTLPEFNTIATELATGHFIRFFIKHAEKFGEPPVLDTFTQVDTFYCLLGGLSIEEHAAGTFLTDTLVNRKPFFTWEPVIKKVFKSQQIFLHFMINSFSIEFFTRITKVYFTDGTNTTFPSTDENNLLRFEVYRIPAGYTQLNIDLVTNGKIVEKYEVWLIDEQGTIISEVRTFTVISETIYSKQILYLNSLGAYNTLSALSKSTGSVSVKADEIKVKLLPGYAPEKSGTEVLSKTAMPSVKLAGEYYQSSEAEHLIDLAIAPEVYEITEKRFSPVRVKMDTQFIDEEKQYIELKVTILPEEINQYTPRL